MTLYSLPSYRMTPRSFVYGQNQGINQTGTPNTKAYERQQKKNRNITIASVLTAAALIFLGKKTKAGQAIIGRLKDTGVGKAVTKFFNESKTGQWIKSIPGKVKNLFSKGAKKADDVLEGTVEDGIRTSIKVEPPKLLPGPSEIISDAGDTFIGGAGI